MDAVKIDIELPSLGLYTKEELTELIQSYSMSLVLSNRVSDLSVEDELRKLNRRAAEMENDPTVRISHERIYSMVMARL